MSEPITGRTPSRSTGEKDMREPWILGWWRSMRTIIVLTLLSPVVVLIFVPLSDPRIGAFGSLATMSALAIGFPIDWYRLRRRG